MMLIKQQLLLIKFGTPGIKDWWFHKNTQDSLNSFKENLARPTKNITDELFKEIKLN